PPPAPTLFAYTTLFRSMIVGTAGHIDHGKTALVKALTGVDADRLAEEKARGITLDLGFAYADLGLPQQPATPSGRVTGFVDVPRSEEHTSELQSRENLV